MFTIQAIQLLTFLIPGFISSRVLDTLVVRKKEHKELEIITEALIFSLLIYAIFSLLGGVQPIVFSEEGAYFSYGYESPKSLVIILSTSIILPVLIAGVLNNVLHMKLAQKLKITKKTGRLSVWHDVFYEKKSNVIINFVDGKRLFGWAEHFSDYADKPYLYLYAPQWIDGDEFIDIGIDGMLITPEQKIAFVEFLKDSEEETLDR